MSSNKVSNLGDEGYSDASVSGLNTFSSSQPYASHTRTIAPVRTFVNSFIGSENPRYKSQIRNGVDATTPASGVKTSISKGTYFVNEYVELINLPPLSTDHVYETRKGSGKIQFSYQPLSVAPANVVSSVHNSLISRWQSQVSSIQSSIEAGQDIGEWKQTRDALISPMSSLRDHTLGYFDKLTKIRPGLQGRTSKRGRVSAKKALADAYLEWTFGWNPLVSDIAQAYVGFQTNSNRPSLHPIEVFAKGTISASDGTEFQSVPFGQLAFTRKMNFSYSERIKGAIKSVVNSSGQSSATDLLRLAPADFVPTVWDLLPYSFIVDYFTNVGDMIQAYAGRTADIAWGCVTKRTKASTMYSNMGWSSTPLDPLVWKQQRSATGGNASYDCTGFSRFPLDQEFLMPSLEFHLPLGSKKPWINMAALLVSRYSKLVPFF